MRSTESGQSHRQLALENTEAAVAEAEAARYAAIKRRGKLRAPAARRNLDYLPEHVPHIEPEPSVCHSGYRACVKIGQNCSERFDIVPCPLSSHRHRASALHLPPSRCGRLTGGGPEMADRERPRTEGRWPVLLIQDNW